MPNYPNTVRSKLPNVGTTIFTVMSRMAQEYDAINLSQGFPDFEVSPKLIELINTYMRKGFNQYAPMAGVMPLREAIAAKMEKLYSTAYNPESEITITAGATQALFTAIACWVNDGDEVIIIEPAYDSYGPAVELAGGKPVYVPLSYPNYQVDWKMVQKIINQKTKMIIINTPQNPTGSILTAADMAELERITKNTEIVILSDEVYEHIIFDGYEHQSVARYPKLAERSFIVYSFGKTFHATGWKTGYCLAPQNLMAEFRKAHQFNVFCVNTPLQMAFADYLQDETNYLGLGEFYQEKRDFFVNLFKGSAYKIVPSSGTYFQLLGYEKLSDKKDTEFAELLTKEHKVGSIPISVFYHKAQDNKVLRFCFAKGNDTLERAAERLLKVANA